MGDRQFGEGAPAAMPGWSAVESAVRTACIFMRRDARINLSARIRALADEVLRDAEDDPRDVPSGRARY